MDVQADSTAALSLRHNPAQPDSSARGVVPTALMTAKAIRALVGLKLAPLGLQPGQDRLLLVLRDDPCLNVCTLAEQMSVRPSTVSKMTDRLVEKGLLVRVEHPADRRKVDVQLTPEGLELCERVSETLGQLDSELLSSLSGEEAKSLLEGLAMLNEVFTRRLRRLR